MIKGTVRRLDKAIHDKDVDTAQKVFREVVTKIDKTASKGTLHKNTAARKKSRLAKRLNRLTAASS